jgi:6-phosphogluconolactonase
MSLEIYNMNKNVAEVQAVFAEIFSKALNGNSFLLGLCGGRSISRVFASIDPVLAGKDIISTLLIDERALPLTNPDTNYYLLNEEFAKTTNIKNQLNLIPFDIENEEKSFDKYESTLAAYEGKFDLIFLGVGEDGHVASIFPNLEISHSVERNYFTFDGSPKPPSKRLTASHEVIEKSKNVVLLVFGEGKRLVLENILNPSVATLECPAKYALGATRTILLTDLEI